MVYLLSLPCEELSLEMARENSEIDKGAVFSGFGIKVGRINAHGILLLF